MIIKTSNNFGDNKEGYTWKPADAKVFWGEIAPNNHLVQLYENEDVFLDTLQSFIESGFDEGDSVVIIGTEEHIKSMDRRLLRRGVNIAGYRENDRYITLNAK